MTSISFYACTAKLIHAIGRQLGGGAGSLIGAGSGFGSIKGGRLGWGVSGSGCGIDGAGLGGLTGSGGGAGCG